MIEILDGGMIFELNKKYNDLGQFAIANDQKLILDIYQSYIDMGCQYVTTCNYGFKSLKLKNWLYFVFESIELIKKVKKKNPKIKVLGCLPPYFESYHDGVIDHNFKNFYIKIINLMKNNIDYFILETQINTDHINYILEQIKKHTDKKTLVSIYPNNFIQKNELENLIENNKDNIYSLLINCCSFDKMKEYFKDNIEELKLVSKNIKYGFYCNKINEKKYSEFKGDKKSEVNLSEYLNNNIIQKNELNKFLEYLNINNYDIIIGGCCGYGTEEMKELINLF